jgi:hypothetical protein
MFLLLDFGDIDFAQRRPHNVDSHHEIVLAYAAKLQDLLAGV